MNRVLTTTAAFVFAATAYANAATTTTTTTTVTPEQESAITTYVTKQKVQSIEAPSGFTVTTGAVLPESVQVYSVPADVGVTGYSYSVIGGQTVLVDRDRKVVRVMK